jgi:hypothetical protein
MPITSRRSTIVLSLAAACCLVAGPTFGQVCGSVGSCVEPSATPGCEDLDCCVTVCGVDPVCCTVAWDASCALLANELCIGLCGAAASGPCNQPNGSPGCSNEACCETICALDAYCCDFEWDFTCAALASFNCISGGPGTCGDPGTGPCTEPQDTGACSDAVCCEIVCDLDPTCCSQSWDLLCVSVAEQFCVQGCSLECPSTARVEAESCGERSNDPCLGDGPGQSPEPLGCGEEVCGRLFVHPKNGFDTDAFSFVVPFVGGSTTRVEISFTPESPAFLAIFADGCRPLEEATAIVASNLCATSVEAICLPPGPYLLVVAPGEPDAIGEEVVDCAFAEYRLAIACLDPCDDPCGTAEGACGIAHGGLGCDDPECCASVCDLDPICCTAGWDALCVEAATSLCGLEAPPNDLCSMAIPASEGPTPFTTIGATLDGPELPLQCDEGFGLSLEADVWFVHEAICNGPLRIETCGTSDFDSRIAVYRGGCKALELVACNDDGLFCAPAGASRVLVDAVCGEAYLIRVGGFKGAAGFADLSLTCLGSPCSTPCPADLDGDGSVSGADLASLLAAWGTSGPVGDLDGDGTVSGADLTALLASWGACP